MAKTFSGACERAASVGGVSLGALRVKVASARKAGLRTGDEEFSGATAGLILPLMLAGTSETAGKFVKALFQLRRAGGELSPGKSVVPDFFASFVKAAPGDVLAAKAQILLFNKPVQLVFQWGDERAIFQTSNPSEAGFLRDIRVIEPELIAAISEYLRAPEEEKRVPRGRFAELEQVAEVV
jgi:hypothetical protein